jgi:hypothetical protein
MIFEPNAQNGRIFLSFFFKKFPLPFRQILYDMTAHQIIALLAVLGLSSFAIVRLKVFKNTQLSISWRLGLWGLKILASVAVLLLYTHFYPKETADLYKYFQDGKTIVTKSPDFPTYMRIISGIGMDNPQVKKVTDATNHWDRKYLKGVWNDNRSIIRINAILYPISGGSLLTHSIIFAFLAYLGLSLLLIGVQRFVSNNKWLAIAIFLIPNLFLWSSGLLKEAILMLNTGILFYAASSLYEKFSLKQLILLLLSFVLFFMTKIYVLICIFPALLYLLFAKRFKRTVMYFFAVHIASVILVLSASLLTDKLDLLHVIDRKQQDFINMVEISDEVGSKVDVPNLNPDILSLISKAPAGLYHSFLRPHPLEWNSPVKILAGLENYALLILLLVAIFKSGKIETKHWHFLLFTLSFVLILYTIIGLSTPVLGALVRYKIPALPFIGASIVLLFKQSKKNRIGN